MRRTFTSAMTLTAALAAPALAQNPPDARVTPPATAGQEQGRPQLQRAERRLQQAAERLEQAARSGDQEAVDQAKQETQQALEAVRQALGQLPPEQRQQVQQRTDRADEMLRGQDSQAGARAVFAVVDVIGLVAVPATVSQPAAGADINVQQPAPNVTVERAQPEVAMVQQGQPDVTMRRSGQPEAGVVPPGGSSQTAQAESQPPNPLYAMRAEELVGRTVYGAQGEEIGEVDRVVVGRQGAPAVIVGVGGFLGIGEHEVAIPLDRLAPGQGDRLTTGLTKEQIGSAEAYDETAHRPIAGDRRIGQVVGG